MNRRFLLLTCLTLGIAASAFSGVAGAQDGGAQDGAMPTVTMETTLGAMVIELYEDKAPKTVANFLRYVDGGFYDGTVFHRVIPDFMVQGGGFTESLMKKQTHSPIENEADNGVANTRGTIAMARTSDPHSATAQFFLNSIDNDYLDHGKTADGWGYAVFGKVVEGLEVIDAISGVETGSQKGMVNVPVTPVKITKAYRTP